MEFAPESSDDIKSAAHRLVESLPNGATWDGVMYRVYVRQAVEAGLRDEAEGRLVDVSEVRRQFGLPSRSGRRPYRSAENLC